jgi:hypothetical protein
VRQELHTAFVCTAMLAASAAAALSGCQSEGSPLPGAGSGEGPLGGLGTGSSGSSTKALPISGGTLVGVGLSRALASDPDRDIVWRIDTGTASLGGKVLGQIELEPGDEPGRIVAGAESRAHVLARRGGVVVSVDAKSGKVLERRAVCAAPRGIDFDEARGELVIACVHGELVTFPESGGEATRTLQLDPDLRDVVIDGERVLVSRFRSAEILVLDRDGVELGRSRPFAAEGRTASVLWRMAPRPGGGAVIAYQAVLPEAPAVATTPDAYGGVSSPPVVTTEVAVIPPGDGPIDGFEFPTPPLDQHALPVDVVALPDGSIAVASAGSGQVTVIGGDPVGGPCQNLAECEPVGVAWVEGTGLVSQYRSPARIGRVQLPLEAPVDRGHALFHRAPHFALACASCHPEGGDDGVVWQFPEGTRRTQYLAGGVGDTLPFHWAGDMGSMNELMSLVFVQRMGGLPLGQGEAEALERWMHGIERLPSPRLDADRELLVAQGRGLYESSELGCVDCHAGPQHTSPSNFDIGKGERFQPARLVDLAARAPYMHDGCATTLRERFDPSCGGDSHGDVSALTEAELDALVAYLETL